MREPASPTRLFLDQARQDFLRTGAIAPSSRFLARAVTSALRPDGRPLVVLEAGAGTGALTREILRWLPPGSRLDVYEVNPVFARHLERTFADGDGHPVRRAGSPRVGVRVHASRVQDLPEGARYDAIISGLPLNNFEPDLVRVIMRKLFAALEPGGVMTWFEYLLIRELKALATGRRERRRLRRVGRVTGSFLQRYEFHREAIFLNIPPAVVHHLRRPG